MSSPLESNIVDGSQKYKKRRAEVVDGKLFCRYDWTPKKKPLTRTLQDAGQDMCNDEDDLCGWDGEEHAVAVHGPDLSLFYPDTFQEDAWEYFLKRRAHLSWCSRVPGVIHQVKVFEIMENLGA